MKTSTRKRLGIVLVIVSASVALVLYIAGVPLLSLQAHPDLFPDGYMTAWSFEVHRPLLAVFIAGLLGLGCYVWPKRKPPRLVP